VGGSLFGFEGEEWEYLETRIFESRAMSLGFPLLVRYRKKFPVFYSKGVLGV